MKQVVASGASVQLDSYWKYRFLKLVARLKKEKHSKDQTILYTHQSRHRACLEDR